MGEYSYRFLTRADIDELNKLYEAAFQTVSTQGLFLWKYFSNPAGNAIVAGAFYNDLLIGSGAMVPEIMNVFGLQETVYKCTDLMTHPAHQKKGISKKINALLNEEVSGYNPPFYYTLCSKISTKSFLKNNWNYAGGVINFFKPSLYIRAYSAFRKSHFESIKIFDSIGNRLDDFRFRNNPSVIALKKTPEFLKWRMLNPNFKYKILFNYSDQGEVNGYLICSITQGKVVNVIDFEAIANDQVILNKLFRCIENITIRETYKALLVMAIKNTPLYHTLKHRRFLYNPFNSGPLVSELDFDIYYADKKRLANKPVTVWDFSGLNYDDI